MNRSFRSIDWVRYFQQVEAKQRRPVTDRQDLFRFIVFMLAVVTVLCLVALYT
jgi:hypothetical protein